MTAPIIPLTGFGVVEKETMPQPATSQSPIPFPKQPKSKNGRKQKKKSKSVYYAWRWEGGFIYLDEWGKKHFIIEKMRNRHRFKVSTRCSTWEAAMKELARFELDPHGYEPLEKPEEALTLEAIEESIPKLDEIDGLHANFLRYQRDVRKRTPEWVAEQKRCLNWWVGQGVSNLRKLTAADAAQILAGTTGRANKTKAIKALYTWLVRVEHKLPNNPLEAIITPQWNPGARRQTDKARSPADIALIRSRLPERYRVVFELAADTAWHVSECLRFAQGGRIEQYLGEDKAVAAVLVMPRHKIGTLEFRTNVSDAGVLAAKAVLEHGGFSTKKYRNAIHDACDEAGVPKMDPNQMRHSVLTYAKTQGTSDDRLGSFAGHRSRTTTAGYTVGAAAPRIPTVLDAVTKG
jgi:site-specific recombinase XerD